MGFYDKAKIRQPWIFRLLVCLHHYRILKQRLSDQFIQKWKGDINNSSRLSYYKNFKTTFELEPYLINITNDTLRKYLTRFRLSAHKLAIETGRHNNINLEDRICIFCNQNRIKSEYHMLLVCPKYREF